MSPVPTAVRRVQEVRQALLDAADVYDMAGLTTRDVEILCAAVIRTLHRTTDRKKAFAQRGEDALKPFQIEYLSMMANGLTDEEMSMRVCRSKDTVIQNIKRIYRALGTNDRGHTVAVALVTGIIEPDEVNVPQRNPEEGFIC